MRRGDLAGRQLPPVGGKGREGGAMTIQELSQLFWLNREIERECVILHLGQRGNLSTNIRVERLQDIDNEGD